MGFASTISEPVSGGAIGCSGCAALLSYTDTVSSSSSPSAGTTITDLIEDFDANEAKEADGRREIPDACERMEGGREGCGRREYGPEKTRGRGEAGLEEAAMVGEGERDRDCERARDEDRLLGGAT